MGRPSKPYYFADRRGWYSTIRGQLVALADGPDDATTKAAAYREFYRQMAAVGDAKRPKGGWTVDGLAEAFLAKCRRDGLTEDTVRLYLDHTNAFRREFGTKRADAVEEDAVARWVADRMESGRWGQATARGALAIVRRLYNWAVKAGHLAENPIKHIELPAMPPRKVVLSPEQYGAVVEATTDPEFRDFLEMLRESGARPKTVRTLEAREIDWAARTITQERHKTRRKTGRALVVRLTPRAVELCRAMADRWPDGPIFRNTDGNPWTRNAVRLRFARLRDALGLPKGGGSYSARHNFVTDCLQAGISVAATAALVGHTSTDMIDAHYNRLQERGDFLSEELAKVRPPVLMAPQQKPDPAVFLDEVARKSGVSREAILEAARAILEGKG